MPFGLCFIATAAGQEKSAESGVLENLSDYSIAAALSDAPRF